MKSRDHDLTACQGHEVRVRGWLTGGSGGVKMVPDRPNKKDGVRKNVAAVWRPLAVDDDGQYNL